MQAKPIVAFLYDFDKTLATDDMQNFSFIPMLGMTSEAFWEETKKLNEKTNMEKILCYMYLMIEKAKEKGIKLTRDLLRALGKDVEFYDGVLTWFSRINEYCDSLDIIAEHYILSSGTKEIIEGTKIAKEFKKIYGCEFLYDEEGQAIWPKIAINYTAKTQFVFRISKGVLDSSDDVKINSRIENKRVPFRNIIYIGDGLTDVPCMTLVKEKGGKSIAIYPKGKKDKVIHLFEEERVDYICSGNYKKNSDLEKIVKLIVDQISISNVLLTKQSELSNK